MKRLLMLLNYFSKKPIYRLLLIIFFMMSLSTSVLSQEDGTIAGKIVDAETGEELIGANVYLDGTTLGAATDLEGNYVILGVPVDDYTMVVSSIGYAELRVTNVKVHADEITKLDVVVSPEILTTETIVVEARKLKNTEASLLKERQKSVSISDAVSAEEISKSGSGDAASAMKRVTGASVIGGKYVFVRGLGERYSATTLNGAELPSADPDKKSFQLDLIPSNMLDNINTKKTFTPDKPGSFTGGLVDVETKSYPEKLSFQISTSASYNSQVTGNDNFILTNTGNTDWLGFDDGSRDIPDLLSDKDVFITTPNSVGQIVVNGDPEQTTILRTEAAMFIDAASKSFNNVMAPVSADAPLNSSFGISLGNTIPVNEKQSFGYFGSLSWNQSSSFYDDGIIGRFKAPGRVADLTALDTVQYFNDTKGSREFNWGSIANFAYKHSNMVQLKASYMHTQSAEASARYVSGFWQDLQTNPLAQAVYETRVLSWVERSLDTYQLSGQHLLDGLGGLAIDWTSSYSINKQDEPDQRYFSNHYTIRARDGLVTYQNPTSLYPQPIRYFRDLEETNFSNSLNFKYNFNQWSGHSASVKAGFAYTKIDREYNQRRFEYRRDGSNITYRDYGPDVASYFSQVGLLDSSDPNPANWEYLLYITEVKSDKNQFTGEQETIAGYAMLDIPIFSDLRFVGGARLEATEMIGVSADTAQPRGELNNTDWLPSISLIYSIQENMNVRLAYSNTLARPTFRELAPYTTFDFAGDFIFAGNADLKRTLIQNYDLRWEWFLSPGEIIAVSGFYKAFENPIERYFDNSRSSLDAAFGVQNVDNARVMGAEFEIRKNLSFISPYLAKFKTGMNFSIVDSKVDIPQEELFVNRQNDPEAKSTREFVGQSPFLFNINLTYDDYESDFTAGIFYNLFGDRLAYITLGAAPDVFERGYGQLDVKVTKSLFEKFEASFSVKNILNSEMKFSQKFKGQEFIYHSYRKGVVYSVSLSYKI